MKNSITSLIFVFLFGLGVLNPVMAQERKLRGADEEYQELKYINAQKVYLKVAEKGYESEEVFSKLANSYYFNAKYYEAAKWYGKLFELNPDQDALTHLRFSQTLKSTGEEARAEEFYDRYIEKSGYQILEFTSEDYLEIIEENSGRYQMQTLEEIYDEDQISYGQTVYDNKLIYSTTENKSKTFLNTIDAWNELSFVTLYEVPIDSLNNTIGKPKKIKGKMKNKFHQSSPVYTKDGNTMYYTGSNQTGKEKRNSYKNLKIYRSMKKGDKWQDPEELSINSDYFSTAHPALSPDESQLYFASNRPGGIGETDLYVVDIDENGDLGDPQNLGEEINTYGRETFPFVAKDSVLYFSSDGHFGMGGMDIFAVKIKEDGHGNIINVGKPINSYADDFAYGIDDETKYGFVSSDRAKYNDTTLVNTNIYSFKETSPLKDPYQAFIEGYVTDKNTKEPLEDAQINFTDSKGEHFVELNTDEEGYYKIETNKFETYTIRASKEDYDTDEKISTPKLEEQRIDFVLQRNVIILTPGVDLANVLNIPIIYFNFDKSNIRPDAQVDLEKVYQVLKEYPEIRINIRSHTDSRGSDAYNLALSDRRAKSTRKYLIGKGIEAFRLEAEGLGEHELVNECSDGVPCSETKHQANRRSEFIILGENEHKIEVKHKAPEVIDEKKD